MNQKAEERAPEAADNGRTDKEKLNDIGLSPEELDALQGDEGGQGASAKDDANKDVKPTDGGQQAAAGDAAGSGEERAPEGDDEGTDEGAEGEAEPSAKVPDHFIPMDRTLTEDELKQIDEDLAELKKEFDDGDVDFEEFTERRLELAEKQWAHRRAEEHNMEIVDQRWKWEREWYLQSNSELNTNQVIFGAFAAQVNALLDDEDFMYAPGFDLLTEAHRRVAAEISSLNGPGAENLPSGSQASGAEKTSKEKAADAIARAKAAESGKKPPATLAKVPAAGQHRDQSRWEAIDRLDGEDYEKAISRLSPTELKEYEDHH
jgi:hypothetical protein